MLTKIPFIQIASFIALMCSGMSGNVISAAIVEIYPTSCRYLTYDRIWMDSPIKYIFFRAMAICIALMFARLGAVFGSNAVAYFSNDYCEATFYTAAGATFCKFIKSLECK